MSNADRLELGSWNVVCWECGRKFKAVDLIKHWRGYYVCKGCFEPRHPQDFVRAVPDVQTPPWVQPRPGWSFGSIVVINLPWTPGGSTLTGTVTLTDYETPPTSGAVNVIVNIPEGLTVTGIITFGTTWPTGTAFTVNNHGIVTQTPVWPANTGVVINGDIFISNNTPSYTLDWNLEQFPLPTLDWNTDFAYPAGASVTSGGGTWRSSTSGNQGNTPALGSFFWAFTGSQSSWVDGTLYSVGDEVVYGAQVYVAQVKGYGGVPGGTTTPGGTAFITPLAAEQSRRYATAPYTGGVGVVELSTACFINYNPLTGGRACVRIPESDGIIYNSVSLTTPQWGTI